jgi:hypothetical protein
MNAHVSPDGRWIAYQSTESGREEVYVQSFPTPGGKVRISINGGLVPQWSRDGRELIYLLGPAVLTVPFASDGTLGAATPQRLFSLPAGSTGFCPTSGGDRFLVSVPDRNARRPEIWLIQNWTELLKR